LCLVVKAESRHSFPWKSVLLPHHIFLGYASSVPPCFGDICKFVSRGSRTDAFFLLSFILVLWSRYLRAHLLAVLGYIFSTVDTIPLFSVFSYWGWESLSGGLLFHHRWALYSLVSFKVFLLINSFNVSVDLFLFIRLRSLSPFTCIFDHFTAIIAERFLCLNISWNSY
jgi:hypothetical protein